MGHTIFFTIVSVLLELILGLFLALSIVTGILAGLAAVLFALPLPLLLAWVVALIGGDVGRFGAVSGALAAFFGAGVVTWRLCLGMLDKRGYGETTFILQFPVWWSFAAALLGAAVFTLVCAYTVLRSLREAGRGDEAG